MIQNQTPRGFLILLVITCVPGMTACETMKENATAAGGAIGGVLGGLVGLASIDKNDSATEKVTKVVGGAGGGAVIGAGLGYLAQKHFDKVEAKSEYAEVKTQEASNEDWKDTHQNQALPDQAVPRMVADESKIEPASSLAPNQDASFKLTWESIGQTPYTGSLCRSDQLYIKDQSELALIKELDDVCNLSTSGKGTHSTVFTLPGAAPAGDYVLKSTVSDPANAAFVPISKDYAFSIVDTGQQTASAQH